MSFQAATEVYAKPFDAVFFALSQSVQVQIEGKIHEMDQRLAQYPHHRLTGSADCRLRVGDYRVICSFDLASQTLYLLAVGHRREIYRKH